MPQLLTDEQVRTFFEQGFVRIDQLFSPQEMAELEAACDRVYDQAETLLASGVVGGERGTQPVSNGSRFTFEPDAGRYEVRHVAWCGGCEPVFDRVGQDERLLKITGDLLGCAEVSQQINQVHYKKPGTAVKFDWHQDAQHRGIHRGAFTDVLGNGSYVQIAVAIDDVKPDSGPLGFIPRSNQHGFLGSLYDADGKYICEKAPEKDAVYPLLKRGDAVAFGSYTIHGSSANTGTTARRTFINGFCAPGADQKVHGLPGVGRMLKIPVPVG